MKPALRNLSRIYLGWVIQESSHDSIEDAKAALRLSKMKVSRGIQFGATVSEGKGMQLFEILLSQKKSVAIFDDTKSARKVLYFFKACV